MDSTIISLFKERLKNPISGKKKGVVEAHTMIKIAEQMPCLARFTEAARQRMNYKNIYLNYSLSQRYICVFSISSEHL